MKTKSIVAVRLAGPADIPVIHRMEQECFSDPWEEASIQAAVTLPHMRAWVAEEGEGAGGAVVGYVVGLLLGGESEVADLAVSPGARGRGIGGMLLDQLLQHSRAEGGQRVFLEVRESNESALKLYRSRAFREVGRRKGYYRNPVEDALLLRHDFEPA